MAEEGADLTKIENEIVTMPNYFADYDTTVHFITEEEMRQNHSGIPSRRLCYSKWKNRLEWRESAHYRVQFETGLKS